MSQVALSSSLRTTPPQVTLARAKRRAPALGITRVTDITRLNRIGIPVYASIRPTAAAGSLCVNAGKGLYPIEAEVGAYMEAIEFALAEPGNSPVAAVTATARDVLDGRRRPEAILDLCPKLGEEIALDAPMQCVAAEEITTGERTLLPAELVFLPFRPYARFRGRFGTSSNGLASGNTLREATVHALAELIERDVRSFQAVHDTSAPVDLDSVEGPPRMLIDEVRDAGLELCVRWAPNEFGLAYFAAVIHDPDACVPHLLNVGYGCHPHRTIAFVRAVAEAAQSRLTFIHGGRDDLTTHLERFEGWSLSRKRSYVRRVVAHAAQGDRVPVTRAPDSSELAPTVELCEELLLQGLSARGFARAYRVAFTAPDDDLAVVRVVVPRLELFSESLFASARGFETMRARAPERVVMFAGPTLAASTRAAALVRRLRVRSPVRRHDVARLTADGAAPGVLVIVDGVFHDRLAVAHAEIREAVRLGWQVWGVSSMGAIRAREMTSVGVKGFGRVFERFVTEADFQDDEVALLHEPFPPYRGVTEPLVHLRAAVDHVAARGLIAEEDARAVIADLKSRWYGERTIRGTLAVLEARARGTRRASAIARELADFHRFAVKTHDLERFLEERPWSNST